MVLLVGVYYLAHRIVSVCINKPFIVVDYLNLNFTALFLLKTTY